ncbi:hypothetical protein SD457_00065 [Coprobacillaceae bacterium CR2/5/TPMF4]|nr:hypothetical protein SD457_00065 [Coprobacillaceae bacterium CR2/5/TPMF4]
MINYLYQKNKEIKMTEKKSDKKGEKAGRDKKSKKGIYKGERMW